MQTFKVGDLVQWTSQAQGFSKTKVGLVEIVKQAGAGLSDDQVRELRSNGMPRSHVSYLVRVQGRTLRARGRLYWPVASLLKPVKTKDVA